MVRVSLHHHHHVMPLARISLTLSRHFSLSFIASGGSAELLPISSHSCCMYVRAGHSTFAQPYVGVHRSTSLKSLSLLLQQCPACLVRLIWIVLWWEAGGRILGALWGVVARTCSILLATFLCNCCLASSPAVLFSVQVVHPYSSINMTTARKKLYYLNMFFFFSISNSTPCFFFFYIKRKVVKDSCTELFFFVLVYDPSLKYHSIQNIGLMSASGKERRLEKFLDYENKLHLSVVRITLRWNVIFILF